MYNCKQERSIDIRASILTVTIKIMKLSSAHILMILYKSLSYEFYDKKNVSIIT